MRLLSSTPTAAPFAVAGEGVRLDGAELTHRVRAAADELRGLGAGPGRLWGWVGPPSVTGVIELHAIVETGAVLAPVNPTLAPAEREAALRSLPLDGWSEIVGDACHRRKPLRPAERAPDRGEILDGLADPIAILWTSGSTGVPRAIILSEAAVRRHTAAVSERLALRSTDVWAATLSPAHVGGLMLVLRAALVGCGLACTGRFQPETFGDQVEGYGVSHASLVPTMLRRWVDRLADAGEYDPPAMHRSLRALLVGGAHAPAELLSEAARRGLPVSATWGMSEMSSQVATATPEETAARPDSVGRPLAGLEVRTSARGELEVRGATRAARRLRIEGEELFEEPLDSGGWFQTGDLGHVSEDGTIRVTGRLGNRIISGGVNVDPLEVESALRALDGVEEALVVGLPDPEWGDRVAALITGPADPSQVREVIAERLAPAKRPRVVRRVDALPLTANGKPDRRAAAGILARRGDAPAG